MNNIGYWGFDNVWKEFLEDVLVVERLLESFIKF